MFVPEKLKLNKFRVVSCPSPRLLAQRFGNVLPPVSAYTGDDVSDDVFTGNKADMFRDMAKFDAERDKK